MYEITVAFMNGEEKIFIGNYTLEGSFVRINHDHDNDKRTPQHTTVYPASMIKTIDSKVIQSGMR